MSIFAKQMQQIVDLLKNKYASRKIYIISENDKTIIFDIDNSEFFYYVDAPDEMYSRQRWIFCKAEGQGKFIDWRHSDLETVEYRNFEDLLNRISQI